MSQRNKALTTDAERLDDIAETKFWQSPFVLKAAHLVISTFIAAVVTVWAVRGYIAERDMTVARQVNEITNTFNQKLADVNMELSNARSELVAIKIKVEREFVPRSEHQAYWDQSKRWQEEMRQDMREVRADIKTLMTKEHANASYENTTRTASR